METTTARPIHPTASPAPNNGRVSTRRPASDGGPIATGIAVAIFMLGALAAAMLLGWTMFRVADLFGLLS